MVWCVYIYTICSCIAYSHKVSSQSVHEAVYFQGSLEDTEPQIPITYFPITVRFTHLLTHSILLQWYSTKTIYHVLESFRSGEAFKLFTFIVANRNQWAAEEEALTFWNRLSPTSWKPKTSHFLTIQNYFLFLGTQSSFPSLYYHFLHSYLGAFPFLLELVVW